MKSDDIPENKYLCPDRGYLDNNYNDYLNKYFYMAGYPQKEFSHLGRAVSSGKITKIKNFSFEHILDSRPGSSGSPICLRESICVVGIHKSGNEAKHKNKGAFIGFVLEELEKEEIKNRNINNCIKLHCRIGATKIKSIFVDRNDYLNILSKKLDINDLKDKKACFVFNSIAYNIDSNQTFQEIGLNDNSYIFINILNLAG